LFKEGGKESSRVLERKNLGGRGEEQPQRAVRDLGETISSSLEGKRGYQNNGGDGRRHTPRKSSEAQKKKNALIEDRKSGSPTKRKNNKKVVRNTPGEKGKRIASTAERPMTAIRLDQRLKQPQKRRKRDRIRKMRSGIIKFVREDQRPLRRGKKYRLCRFV